MPRSESTREAITVLSVYKRIPRKGWITVKQMSELLAVDGICLSVRSLQRILKDLTQSSDFNVEINNKAKPYGYRRGLPISDFVPSTMTPQTALLLRMADEYLRAQLPNSVLASLSPIFEAAEHTLNEKHGPRELWRWLRKVGFVSSTIKQEKPDIKPRIFRAVSEALYRDVLLDIVYRNSLGVESRSTVTPLGLVQQESRLYLVCQFEGRTDFRHLALHRIERAGLTDIEAVRPEGFSLDKYVSQQHFNFSNGAKTRFVVEFTSPTTALTLTETPFNRTQTLTKLADGAYRLEAILDDTVLLDGWVASWKKAAGIRLAQKFPIPNVKPEDGAAALEPTTLVPL